MSDATVRHDIEAYWPAGNPIGIGNSVHDNCVWGGNEGSIDTSAGGFTATNNLDVDPELSDAATHDYEMSVGSPCLALVGDVQAAVDGTTATVPSNPGPTPDPTPTPTAAAPASGGTGSAVSPSAPASPTPSQATTPPPAAPKSTPAAHPKPKHTTRKPVKRRRLRLRKRRRRTPRRSYPSLRRLP